ncbi:uncharacterized protein vret [Anabrus simplex]|uniref:uncharacterized protein vret n=1 Tax=Anabrus simplex TaxID=316456 RepID=UPI0035A38828
MLWRQHFSQMAGRYSLPARRPQMDWDPMHEDYYDPNFNNYNFGPGSRMDLSLQPWNPRREEKRLYKLYIQNIPPHLDECGLCHYFANRHAATPVDAYVNPPAPGSALTWGFAYYERQSDAEYAIRAVSGKPPFCLKVQFARSDEEKNRLRNVVEEEDRWKTSLALSPYVPVDDNDQYVQRFNGLGRGRRFPSHSGQLRPGYYLDPIDDYYDGYYGEEDVGFDGYSTVKEDPSIRMSRQALQRPELLKIECDGGQRRVSMGRGYFRSNEVDGSDGRQIVPVNQAGLHPSGIVTPHTTGLSLTERTVRLCQGNYEFGTLPDFEEGPCGSCKRYTTKHCGYCSQWYCSRECQRKDWELHQPLCQRMPPLEDSRTKTDISRRPAVPNGDVKVEPALDHRVTIKDIPSTNSRVDGIVQTSFPEGGCNVSAEVNKLTSKTEGVSLNDSGNVAEEHRRGKDGLLGEFPGTSENNGRSGDLRGRKENCGILGDRPRQGEFSGNELHHDRRNQPRHRRQDVEQQNPKRNQGNRTKSTDRFGGGRHDRRSSNNNSNNKQRNDQEEKNDGEQISGQRLRSSGDLHDSRRTSNNGLRNEVRRDAYKNDGQRRNATGQKSYSRERSKEQRETRNSANDNFKNDREEPMRNVLNCESQLNSHSFDDSAKLHQSEMSSTGNELQEHLSSNGELQETKTSAPSTGAIPKSRSRVSGEVVQDSNCSSNASAEKTAEDLPRGLYTEVKVVLAEGPLDYWVQLKSREQDVLDLLRELLSLDENSPVADLKVGELCACQFEGIWYRARILTVSPDLKVHYVDYGNTEVVQDSKALKCLPPQFLKLPDQAIRIQLATGTSEKWKNLAEETTLFVKPSKVVGDLNVVHVQGETYDEQPIVGEMTISGVTLSNTCNIEPVDDRDIQAKTIAGAEGLIRNDRKLLNSSVSLLQCGICGYLQYQVALEPGKFIASIVCEEFEDSFRKVMVGLADHAPTAKPLDDPQPRDLVLAFSTKRDSWLRAYIISTQDQSYHVAFCDTGELERVSEVKQLGSEYRTICAMAVQCTVTDTILKPETKARELLKVSENFKFEVLSTTETSALIFLKVKDGEKPFCKAKLSPWLPPFKHNLKCVQLKDGPFSLSTFITPKDVFVRPVDKNASSLFARIMQDLNGFCHKVPGLDQMPSIGDLVAGKYSGDGNYYRALIRKIDENDIKVSYVDFGNCEVLHLDNLKPITEELKSYPCFAVKVILKDVLDQPLNKEVGEYFGEIVRKDLELKLKVVDSQSKLIELHLPDGTSVNEKVNTLMEPSWKKSDSSRLMEEDIYMFSDMAVVELPVREVKLGIQQILTCNQIAVVNMEDPVLIENVHLTMASTMNSYCNETDQKSYVPRQGEACLANYQGEWFRAVCVGTGQGLFSVMFIDYGNFSEVKHTDIRKMVKEFYETPALTCLCKIKGIDEESQNEKKIMERLRSLIPLDSILSIKVAGKTEDQLHYEVEIPHVISTLANEGLL